MTANKKYIVLCIFSGEPLYRWVSNKRRFEIAVFDNKALAGHAITDFITNDYIIDTPRRWMITPKPRAAKYVEGLYTSEFVALWNTKYNRSLRMNKGISPVSSRSWKELGLKTPSKEEYTKEMFLVMEKPEDK